MVSDGKTLSTYMPIMDKYTQAPAPDNLSDLFDPMSLMVVGGSPTRSSSRRSFAATPSRISRRASPRAKISAPKKSSTRPRRHVQVANRPLHHRFLDRRWPDAELLQTRTAMDMASTLKKLSASQQRETPAGTAGMTMSTTVTYSNWKFDQPIARTFSPSTHPATPSLSPNFCASSQPARGQGRARFLAAGSRRQKGFALRSARQGRCARFLGDMVRPVCRDAAQGHQGHLCARGPGRRLLLGQSARKSRRHPKIPNDQTTQLPVLLDIDGKLADLYGAKAIPQTVIIDKTGKIQVIHVGYDVSLDKTLTPATHRPARGQVTRDANRKIERGPTPDHRSPRTSRALRLRHDRPRPSRPRRDRPLPQARGLIVSSFQVCTWNALPSRSRPSRALGLPALRRAGGRRIAPCGVAGCRRSSFSSPRAPQSSSGERSLHRLLGDHEALVESFLQLDERVEELARGAGVLDAVDQRVLQRLVARGGDEITPRPTGPCSGGNCRQNARWSASNRTSSRSSSVSYGPCRQT